jgi:hypothetical protein
MDEGFTKLVIVPIGIALFVFCIEWLAAQSKGSQDGDKKFKLWIKEANKINPDLPKGIPDIRELILVEVRRSKNKQLVDIVELASIESFTGLGFDLVAASLTADILAIFRANVVGVSTSNLTTWLVIHLFFLFAVAALTVSNGRARPQLEATSQLSNDSGNASTFFRAKNWLSKGQNHRTVLAILVGMFSLITSFVNFWDALV